MVFKRAYYLRVMVGQIFITAFYFENLVVLGIQKTFSVSTDFI